MALPMQISRILDTPGDIQDSLESLKRAVLLNTSLGCTQSLYSSSKQFQLRRPSVPFRQDSQQV